jgi:hypothetical protein
LLSLRFPSKPLIYLENPRFYQRIAAGFGRDSDEIQTRFREASALFQDFFRPMRHLAHSASQAMETNMPRNAICLLTFALMTAHAGAGDPAGWHRHGPDILLQHRAHLLWTQNDNGQEIDWPAARAYCAGIGAGWRLPSVAELSAVAAEARLAGDSAACGVATCQATPLLRLGGAWFWSGAAVANGEDPESERLAWGVTLANGRPTMAFRRASSGSRALCVHSA